jgi:hypothetical protein
MFVTIPIFSFLTGGFYLWNVMIYRFRLYLEAARILSANLSGKIWQAAVLTMFIRGFRRSLMAGTT